jgi:hypothetical protein
LLYLPNPCQTILISLQFFNLFTLVWPITITLIIKSFYITLIFMSIN